MYLISMAEQLLAFISNEALIQSVKNVLSVAKSSIDKADKNFFQNVIDPFSALFGAVSQGVTLTKWIESEKQRQMQKTLQNAIGVFHQEILGSAPNWENLGTGKVIDLKCTKYKIIAEVKNKFNTTKGNHKKEIYNDFSSLLSGDYKGYIGYYVEIIPKNKKRYDKSFTPSDNVSSCRKQENKNIRVIDGYSFYEKVTGRENALKELYNVLPKVIAMILGVDPRVITADTNYKEFFEKAY